MIIDRERDMRNIQRSWEQQGIEKGIEQGIEKAKYEIALKLLADGHEIEFIKNITDLSVEKLKELKEKLQSE